MFDIYEMGRFSLEQSWEILKTYFQSGESSTQTVRNLRKKIDKKDVPTTQFVDQFVKRVRETGSLLDKTTRVRTRPVRSTENIAAVAQSVREQPSTSTRHRSQELNISRTSLRRILHKDLGRRHLVSTGRRNMSHSQRNNRSFAHCFRKSHNQPKC